MSIFIVADLHLYFHRADLHLVQAIKAAQIICHLGLGDLIITSAIAEWLIANKYYDKVYYPTRPQDEASVRSFFLLSPDVEIYLVHSESTTPPYHEFLATGIKDAVLFRLGFYADHAMDSSLSFGEAFYAGLGIPYSTRFDLCPIQRVVDVYYDASLNVYMQQYSLVHEDPVRGYYITSGHITNPYYITPGTASVLAYYPLIKHAAKIQAIDSFLIHLVDSVKTTAELEYHKYARPRNHRWNDRDVPSKHNHWIIINE